MRYPNKTYVLDIVRDSGFSGKCRHVVIVTAVNAETAVQHLKGLMALPMT